LFSEYGGSYIKQEGVLSGLPSPYQDFNSSDCLPSLESTPSDLPLFEVLSCVLISRLLQKSRSRQLPHESAELPDLHVRLRPSVTSLFWLRLHLVSVLEDLVVKLLISIFPSLLPGLDWLFCMECLSGQVYSLLHPVRGTFH
jgi:hypothetical protein